jgi:EAL domain-containing protein (putative c-di-GMP-specific phosphodiesterase class I)
MPPADIDRARLAAELQGAAARGELVVYYQPQIEIGTGRVVAVEALSRWAHPTLGTVMPDAFIPFAEENGLMHEVGGAVLSDSCACIRDWGDHGWNVEVAVNVAPAQLVGDRFFDDLDDALGRGGSGSPVADPSRLILEITESDAIADVDAVAARLDALRERGVTISIDDFGIGHSSVQRVVDLRATELKLDRDMVARQAAGVVGAAIDFAHGRGLRVVGEGVENEAQLRMLAELGCDRAQGYLIARPAPRLAFERWARSASLLGS